MGETTVKIFLAFISIILIVFIIGIVIFVIQYRKRKLMHESEKIKIREQHQFELLNTQVKSQQQTMQDIGREIHDNVGQKLTLASLYAKRLSQTNPVNDLGTEADTIGKIIDESLSALRQLSKTLINPQLAMTDIVSLLREEATQINATGMCLVTISSNEANLILPLPQKNILFRLIQEFLQNSLKHSGCRQIQVALKKDNNGLLVKASDDGKGFDTSLPVSGLGLRNMQLRAEQLAASYELISEHGKGTSVSIHLPIINES